MSIQNWQTGIVKSDSDKIQPYRVWYKGNIIWFARTLEEANLELKKKG